MPPSLASSPKKQRISKCVSKKSESSSRTNNHTRSLPIRKKKKSRENDQNLSLEIKAEGCLDSTLENSTAKPSSSNRKEKPGKIFVKRSNPEGITCATELARCFEKKARKAKGKNPTSPSKSNPEKWKL